MGTESGATMGTGTEQGRERGRGWIPVEEHRMGTGTETRAVAEIGTGTRMGTGTGTRIGSGRAEEKRRSARDRTRVVDAMLERGRLGWKEEKV